jgi:hypothetical protein
MDIDDMYNDNYTRNAIPHQVIILKIIFSGGVWLYTKGMNTLIVPNTSDSSENLISSSPEEETYKIKKIIYDNELVNLIRANKDLSIMSTNVQIK